MWNERGRKKVLILNDGNTKKPNPSRFFSIRPEYILYGIVIAGILIIYYPFFISGILGGIFALAYLGFRDQANHLEHRKKTYLNVALVFVGISLIYLLINFWRQFIEFLVLGPQSTLFMKAKKLTPQLIQQLTDFIHGNGFLNMIWTNKSDVQVKISEYLTNLADAFLSNMAGWLGNIPMLLLHLGFFVFTFSSLTFNRKFLEEKLILNNSPNSSLSKPLNIFEILKKSGFNSVIVTFFSASVQAMIMTIGASALGVEAWPVIFIATLFCALLPIVGVLPVSIVVIFYIWTTQGSKNGIIMLFISLFVSISDNIVRPILMSESDKNFKINPILSFFGLIGGVYILGFPGLFIAPFLIVLASHILKNVQMKRSKILQQGQ